MTSQHYRFDEIKLLIVEDNRPMYELIKSVMLTFGVKKIYRAKDGHSGFDAFCDIKPDLIITDWMMKPGSGIDLIKDIRNHPLSPDPYAPVILLTGYSQKARVAQARDIGATEFLVKPFCAKDLYKRIVHVIENPRNFVDSDDFFGPDRRRHADEGYKGYNKRMDDVPGVPVSKLKHPEYVYVGVEE